MWHEAAVIPRFRTIFHQKHKILQATCGKQTRSFLITDSGTS
ncbi:extracellular matrix/biofilm biosynthesis regulator RemA family protein [Sorangium sp. So ce726]